MNIPEPVLGGDAAVYRRPPALIAEARRAAAVAADAKARESRGLAPLAAEDAARREALVRRYADAGNLERVRIAGEIATIDGKRTGRERPMPAALRRLVGGRSAAVVAS